MRWFILLVVVAFVVGQVMRLRPSSRDVQLQKMRQAASRLGLFVRFWTLRASGYTQYGLPESGFMYSLPLGDARSLNRWVLWMTGAGDVRVLSGTPPDLARDWLQAFRQRHPDSWILLEYSDSALSVLWEEKGGEKAVEDLAGALSLLKKSI
jgi:hypothetical protein